MSSTDSIDHSSKAENEDEDEVSVNSNNSNEESRKDEIENNSDETDNSNKNSKREKKKGKKSHQKKKSQSKQTDTKSSNDNDTDSESQNANDTAQNDNDESQNVHPSQSNESSRKVDRYGTFIQENPEITADERELLKEESQKEFSREMKWAYMTKHWKSTSPKVIHRRIKKGIPDCMRSLAWRLILDPDSQNPQIYTYRPSIKSLVQKGRQECCNIIEVDLPRTMPQMEIFQKANAINSLRSILHAYSNYDQDLGYTQGMAFYAAILLCYMEEEQSFWCFVNLMRGKQHHLRNFFLPGFPALDKIGKVWEYYINHHFKKLAKKLEEIGLGTIMYVPSWFMCNFFNMAFPMVMKLRLFDCFLGFGTRAIFSFAITIIKMNEEVLLSSSMEEALQILQRPYEHETMQNWRVVIKNYQDNFLKESKYRSFFKKAGVKYIP